jgi:hypothetical protein
MIEQNVYPKSWFKFWPSSFLTNPLVLSMPSASVETDSSHFGDLAADRSYRE